ncbi:hypothetical protein LARI1_G007719 [Lachnellula arida]|uniref:Aminoglycoside phosphotransferase domain-containing protein n=1 Tax=Lachnellula arida TaxID=1316785 RepID=A0A8T9B513_9HELO|nr:hypothetical protein LARI1_G007719 [Lachnellula arida]
MESDQALALALVHGAKLGHPDLPLVECFLRDAKDADEAARYLLQTCADDTNGSKFTQFVEDWKTLVTTCRFWNSSRVFPIIPLSALQLGKGRSYDILGAFITPSQREHLLSTKDATTKNLLSNHWTLSNDTAKDFARGEIRHECSGAGKYNICWNPIGITNFKKFTPRQLLEWRPDLSDLSNSNIDGPDPALLEIHSRFSKALKWTHVAVIMQRNAHQRYTQKTTRTHFTEAITTSLLAIWLKLPTIMRLQAYKVLKTAGLYLYGCPQAFGGVQRLPFGMYAKYTYPGSTSKRLIGEFAAVKLVRSRTSLPVPRPIDLICTPTEIFMLTSRMPGIKAGLALDYLRDEELRLMAVDLQKWIAELHTINPAPDSTFAIANASGGACFDFRIGGHPVGPFRTEKEFSAFLRIGAFPGLVHRDDHKIVFTHADLNMKNILLHNGRISGIVGWETAGWYPEYWEMTKCHYNVRLDQRWLEMVEEVFEHRYEEELEIEKRYFEHAYGF